MNEPTQTRSRLPLITAIVVVAVVAVALVARGQHDSADATDGKPTASSATAAATIVMPDEPTTFDVTGVLKLTDSDLGKMGDVDLCWGQGGYDDIDYGAQVVIYDNAGTMLASGELSTGEIGQYGVVCKFEFSVPGVPIADVDLYAVEIASRGKITFTQAEASDVELTLG